VCLNLFQALHKYEFSEWLLLFNRFVSKYDNVLVAFSALTLLVGRHEGHPACKKMGGWWRWALVSPDGVDGVAPSQMVGVSACVNLPLYHKVQKFSSGMGFVSLGPFHCA